MVLNAGRVVVTELSKNEWERRRGEMLDRQRGNTGGEPEEMNPEVGGQMQMKSEYVWSSLHLGFLLSHGRTLLCPESSHFSF